MKKYLTSQVSFSTFFVFDIYKKFLQRIRDQFESPCEHLKRKKKRYKQINTFILISVNSSLTKFIHLKLNYFLCLCVCVCFVKVSFFSSRFEEFTLQLSTILQHLSFIFLNTQFFLFFSFLTIVSFLIPPGAYLTVR